MRPEVYSLLQTVHGILGGFALVLLLHPLVALSRATEVSDRVVRLCLLAGLMAAAPFTLGWWLYPTYRVRIKPSLFVQDNPAWLWFESKEHLAALFVILTISGALTLWLGRAPARRAAWWMLAMGWLCGVGTAILGTVVAAVAHPGW